MTAAKKLLLAAAIVSAGYGMAILLGPPSLLPTSQVLSLAEANRGAAPQYVPPPQANIASPPFGLPTGGARLVPDRQGEATSHFRVHETDATNSKRVGEAEQVPSAVVAVAPPTGTVRAPELMNSGRGAEPTPRGRLLNEAPRPMAVESYATEAAQHVPPARADVWSDHEVKSPTAPQNIPSRLMQAQFTSSAGLSSGVQHPFASANAPAILANGLAPLASNSAAPIAEAEEPRSHIVVDGDSLAKLAGRYLDDPRRAGEIYELNREVLRNPELLPIGVELVVPPRSAIANGAINSPHSFMPRAVAIHSATGSGLVPISPIPRTTSVTPRAFLAPPRHPE